MCNPIALNFELHIMDFSHANRCSFSATYNTREHTLTTAAESEKARLRSQEPKHTLRNAAYEAH